MKAFHHPHGNQREFLTGLAHLYNLIPYQRRAKHAGQCGVEVEGGRVPTVVSANLLHGFGQFNLRKPRRREREVGRKWWKTRTLPRMPWTGISDFLTISTHISNIYALTFVYCFPLWPS